MTLVGQGRERMQCSRHVIIYSGDRVLSADFRGRIVMSEGRRLPVYLVLDCSGSMSGEPIEAVRQGVKALLSDLRGDPQALETAYLSVITFSSGAQQVCPLTELMTFQEPNLDASG